jgi:hypothetical protein
LRGFERVVGSGDSRLDQRDGVLGAGRGVLHSGVDQGAELGLGVGSGGFGNAADFGAGRSGDVVQLAAVGSGLFSGRLQHAGLQREQFLGVLDRECGAGCVGDFAERGLRDLQVQLDQLFDAREGLAGQTQQGFGGGLVGGGDLFDGQHGGVLCVTG